MIRISIAERFKPFSHTPGTKYILPYSTLTVQVFPTLIRVEEREIPLELTGPVVDFTAQIDLEKGQTSGMIDAIEALRSIEEIACVELNRDDIVRHKLVQNIVQAYGKRRKRTDFKD